MKGALVARLMHAPNREGLSCSPTAGEDSAALSLECVRRQKTLMALRRRFEMAAVVRD